EGVIASAAGVKAGGGGVGGKSKASADLLIKQKAKQKNVGEQSQGAGNGGASQGQLLSQTNKSGQKAKENSASALREGVIASAAGVKAGGDGVVGKSKADAGLYIKQNAKQKNKGTQSQTAGDDGASQDQLLSQTNNSEQKAKENSASALSEGVIASAA